jgi:hypothetical protein
LQSGIHSTLVRVAELQGQKYLDPFQGREDFMEHQTAASFGEECQGCEGRGCQCHRDVPISLILETDHIVRMSLSFSVFIRQSHYPYLRRYSVVPGFLQHYRDLAVSYAYRGWDIPRLYNGEALIFSSMELGTVDQPPEGEALLMESYDIVAAPWHLLRSPEPIMGGEVHLEYSMFLHFLSTRNEKAAIRLREEWRILEELPPEQWEREAEKDERRMDQHNCALIETILCLSFLPQELKFLMWRMYGALDQQYRGCHSPLALSTDYREEEWPKMRRSPRVDLEGGGFIRRERRYNGIEMRSESKRIIMTSPGKMVVSTLQGRIKARYQESSCSAVVQLCSSSGQIALYSQEVLWMLLEWGEGCILLSMQEEDWEIGISFGRVEQTEVEVEGEEGMLLLPSYTFVPQSAQAIYSSGND